MFSLLPTSNTQNTSEKAQSLRINPNGLFQIYEARCDEICYIRYLYDNCFHFSYHTLTICQLALNYELVLDLLGVYFSCFLK